MSGIYLFDSDYKSKSRYHEKLERLAALDNEIRRLRNNKRADPDVINSMVERRNTLARSF